MPSWRIPARRHGTCLCRQAGSHPINIPFGKVIFMLISYIIFKECNIEIFDEINVFKGRYKG